MRGSEKTPNLWALLGCSLTVDSSQVLPWMALVLDDLGALYKEFTYRLQELGPPREHFEAWIIGHIFKSSRFLMCPIFLGFVFVVKSLPRWPRHCVPELSSAVCPNLCPNCLCARFCSCPNVCARILLCPKFVCPNFHVPEF